MRKRIFTNLSKCFLFLIFLLLTINFVASSNGVGLAKEGTDEVYFTFDGEPLLFFGGMSDLVDAIVLWKSGSVCD